MSRKFQGMLKNQLKNLRTPWVLNRYQTTYTDLSSLEGLRHEDHVAVLGQ